MLKISHLQKNYRGFSLDCSMEDTDTYSIKTENTAPHGAVFLY